jgi:hypothetical protein
MAALLAHKIVAALPETLAADSVYYVRVGAGFDLYVTNGAGQITAYPLNSGGGSLPAWQTVEVNLATPEQTKTVFVPVPGMTAAQKIEVMRSTLPATGKGSDEHLAEPATLAAFAETGGFQLQVMAQGCTVGGSMNINYRVT